MFDALFERPPTEMHSGDRVGWVMHLRGVALSSDAFFPFRDSIDRAQQVQSLPQPSSRNRACVTDIGIIPVGSCLLKDFKTYSKCEV